MRLVRVCAIQPDARSCHAAITTARQIRALEVNQTFADHISQGDLNANYGSEQTDSLGKSLLNMRQSVLHAADWEGRDKFFNVGLAQVGEILRQHSGNIQNLTDKVIQEVVSYMQANQGFIFVRHGGELKLMAARHGIERNISRKQLQ
jgi:hypothetical protein